ncbi:MAG: alpha/beta hydrolase [Planctomycetaceae bacterium]|nr:alpha/beta hydrolase [Planctomycetaceae bacterium]
MRYLLTVAVVFQSSLLLAEVGPEPILLWPDGAPGAMGADEIDRPSLRIYPAPEVTATGAAVLICPGGGYGALAYDHEGHQVAKWLNSIGVTGAVLRYRLGPKYHHPAPLNDAQRGLRYLRANAASLGIDPQRIGVMGFSAGGHLASTLSTHFNTDEEDLDATDPIDDVSCRPDFAILAYPVISIGSEFGHKGSLRNLLGDDPDPELVQSLTNETQVTSETPPTFIFHTAEDPGVKVQNALVYYTALIEHGVKAELHVYQNGPHGVGLAPGDPVLGTWKERLQDWLRTNGFLARTERAGVSGEIQLDGEPLRWGMVALYPDRSDERSEQTLPIAFAMVARGKFSIPEWRGPAVGTCRVQVVTLGDVQPRPTLENSRPLVTVGQEVRLQVAAGANEFSLNLMSP